MDLHWQCESDIDSGIFVAHKRREMNQTTRQNWKWNNFNLKVVFALSTPNDECCGNTQKSHFNHTFPLNYSVAFSLKICRFWFDSDSFTFFFFFPVWILFCFVECNPMMEKNGNFWGLVINKATWANILVYLLWKKKAKKRMQGPDNITALFVLHWKNEEKRSCGRERKNHSKNRIWLHRTQNEQAKFHSPRKHISFLLRFVFVRKN